jgi:protein-S-isoprenylcysteine O-methyltransferase Ste14
MDINNTCVIIFLVFTILFAIRRIRETFLNPSKIRGEIKEKISLPILTLVYVFVCSVAVLDILIIRSRINLVITSFGIFLYINAFLLRSWAFRTLGEYYSPHIEIRKEQPLIIKGPYRFIRHPIYLGVMLELLSFTIISNSYYALVLAVFLYLPILLIRMYQEEISMMKEFGSAYLQYKKEVNAILPLKKHSR